MFVCRKLIAGLFAAWMLMAFVPSVLADDLIVARDYFEDQTGALTFADVQGQAFKPFTPPFSKGYSESNFWFRLKIDPSRMSQTNQGSEPHNIIVRIRPPYLREIEFFDPAYDSGRRRLSGDRFSSRHDEYRSLNLGFIIPAGDTPRDVYVRMRTSTSTFINLEAFSADEVLQIDYQQFAFFLLFVSFLIISAVYGIVLLALLRRAIFLWFIFRQSVALYWSVVSFGIMRFAFPDQGLNFPFLMSFAVFAITFASQLFDYLFLKELRTHKFVQFSQIALLIWTLVSLLFLATGDLRMSNQLVIAGALVFQTVSAVGSWLVQPTSGEKVDRVMKWATAISYTLLTFFIYVALLTHFGVFANSSMAIYSAVYHTTISTFLVAFLLSHRALKAIEAKRLQQVEMLIVTERLALERHLREDQAALLSMLSHELRTPLAGVQMAFGTVQVHSVMSERIGETLGDMSELIEKCLSAVKVEDGHVEIEIGTCFVTDLVSDGLAAVNSPDRFDLSVNEQLSLETDAKLLEIIFKNLVGNAEKYAEPGTRISIKADRSVQPGGGVDILVSNVPMGGEWPDRASVFQKYYRGGAGRRRTGSGLGLYLSFRFAQWIGGQLSYEPTDDLVRFRIWLPT